MLKIAGISKRFGSQQALSSVDLEIQRGEFFSLLGPSGCGKTTLLRILSGFEHTDQGHIFLRDRTIEREPPHKRPCNLIFQRYALFPHLNVQKNVAFGLEMKKLKHSEIDARVAEALATVEMTEFATRSVTTLSGGQQQRVAIARAIVNRPQFLLLDEPLAALDLKLRQRMQIELRELQKRLGITFIFVTHAQDEALSLSDRIAVMHAGRIEQVGSPEDIYHRPQTAFVANFIGSINMLPGKLVQQDANEQQVEVQLGCGSHVRAMRGSLSTLAPGSKVLVLIRPEDLQISPSATHLQTHSNHNGISAVVCDRIFRGSNAELHLERPSIGQKLMAQISSFSHKQTQQLTAGVNVNLSWQIERALVLADDGSAGTNA